MPTSVHVFAEVAARYGGVDPLDTEAVRRFYGEVLPTLAPDRILAILEELLTREADTSGEAPEAFYPTSAAIPDLVASPSVPLPLLAAGWRSLARRLLRRDPDRPRT